MLMLDFFRGSELIMKISSLLSSKTSTTERKELNELKDQHRYNKSSVVILCMNTVKLSYLKLDGAV